MNEEADKNLSWSFFQIWNDSLETPEKRIYKPRDHMWAGELGGSFIDRYLKMTGIEPTNPPNARSLRKFEAGNLMEWVVKMVLKRAGILIGSGEWVEFQYPDLIQTTGRLDHEAGGKIDWEKAKAEVKLLDLPEFFDRATTKIIEKLSEEYPEGMKQIILEVKSLSVFQFEIRSKLRQAQTQHILQNFHYLKAKNYEEGHIVYICRDDLRMLEFGISNPSPTIEAIYKEDITKMTNFIKNKIEPEKEKEILFDEENAKFNKNWRVEYSNYLTRLYGYERPDQYADKWKKQIGQFNRVLGRCIRDEKMTPANLEIITEIEKLFPDWKSYINIGKELAKKGLFKEEEELTNNV